MKGYLPTEKKMDELTTHTLTQADKVVNLVKAQTQKYNDVVEDYVQDNPLQSLGIVLATGLLAGVLIGFLLPHIKK